MTLRDELIGINRNAEVSARQYDVAGVLQSLVEVFCYLAADVRRLADVAATWQQGNAGPAATATNQKPARD